jgi:hypothetical protein
MIAYSICYNIGKEGWHGAKPHVHIQKSLASTVGLAARQYYDYRNSPRAMGESFGHCGHLSPSTAGKTV